MSRYTSSFDPTAINPISVAPLNNLGTSIVRTSTRTERQLQWRLRLQSGALLPRGDGKSMMMIVGFAGELYFDPACPRGMLWKILLFAYLVCMDTFRQAFDSTCPQVCRESLAFIRVPTHSWIAFIVPYTGRWMSTGLGNMQSRISYALYYQMDWISADF